jgi:hypothetical protein
MRPDTLSGSQQWTGARCRQRCCMADTHTRCCDKGSLSTHPPCTPVTSSPRNTMENTTSSEFLTVPRTCKKYAQTIICDPTCVATAKWQTEGVESASTASTQSIRQASQHTARITCFHCEACSYLIISPLLTLSVSEDASLMEV